jgi:hypothetical protein
MKLKKKFVEHFDDERELDNGIIVTLHFGFSFYGHEHLGVMSFDTIREVENAEVFPCNCDKYAKCTR